MPSCKTHCAISKKRTGKTFRELHKWIDEHSKKLRHNHRIKRHAYNEKDEKTIRDYWEEKGKGLGEKAVIEWLFHIALDNMVTAFKKSQKVYGKNTYNFFEFGLCKSKYIHLNFDKKSEEELKVRKE